MIGLFLTAGFSDASCYLAKTDTVAAKIFNPANTHQPHVQTQRSVFLFITCAFGRPVCHLSDLLLLNNTEKMFKTLLTIRIRKY